MPELQHPSSIPVSTHEGESATCSSCQSKISKKASICPHCRTKLKRGIGCSVFLGMILFLLIAFAGCVSLSSSTSTSDSTSISSDNAGMSYVQAKNYVKTVLKSPSSAKFPYLGEGTKVGTGTYQVDSYVDSQNGFGAIMRSTYSITLQFTGGDPADQRNWNVMKFTLDGEDLLNQ